MLINKENATHISVLKNEVLDGLNIEAGKFYLDGTLGLAGHSRAILDKSEKKAFLIGLDRDQDALLRARENLKDYQENSVLIHSAYADFDTVLEEVNLPNFKNKFDGILLDLGVSSLQIDVAERGFSFHTDAKLDMRMNSNSSEQSAEQFINKADFNTLKNLIAKYGEDPQAGRIARAIVDYRQTKTISTTKELAEIVYNAYPAKWRATARNHPATRTFQAIRMQINEELQQLETFLQKLLPYLNKNARIAIISFHSLEDRIVKHTFRTWATDCLCSKQLPVCICKHKAEMKLINKKPILPSAEEVKANPRASSAKLRVAEYIL